MAKAQNFSLKAVISCSDKLSPILKKAKKNLAIVDRSFKSVSESAMELGAKLALPLTALAGGGLLSVQGAVDRFAALGDSIDKAAARAGVGTGALQKLRLAAEFGGASADQMDEALVKLSYNMQQAVSGNNQTLADMFKQLGINLRDGEGNMRSSATVMRDLAEAIKANEDPSKRLAILTAALGEDVGKMLVPVLKDGAQGLDDVAKKAEELGIVMSDTDVKSAAKLTDTMTLFHKVLDSVFTTIGAKLAPTLMQLVERFQDLLVKNKDLIALQVERFVKSLSKAIDDIPWSAIVSGVGSVIGAVSDCVDAIGGFKTILVAIGAVLAGNLLVNIWRLGSAIVGLGQAFTAAFGIPGVAIAGAIVAISLFVKNWDAVKAKVDEVWTTVQAFFADFVGPMLVGVNAAFSKSIEWLLSVGKGIKSFFASVFNCVSESLSGVIEFFDKIPGFSSLYGGSKLEMPALAATGAGSRSEVTVKVVSGEGTKARVEDVKSAGGDLTVEDKGAYSFGDLDL